MRVRVYVENVSNKRVLGRRVFVPSVRKGQHLDINPLLMNGAATRVLIQHKAKKEKKKKMDEKKGKCCAMQSRLMWEEDFLAALLPASSSGSGAEQRVLKIACFFAIDLGCKLW